MTKEEFDTTRAFLEDELVWEDQVMRKYASKLNGMLVKSDPSSEDELHKLLKMAQKQQRQIDKMIGITESLFWLDEMYENEKEDAEEDRIEN